MLRLDRIETHINGYWHLKFNAKQKVIVIECRVIFIYGIWMAFRRESHDRT